MIPGRDGRPLFRFNIYKSPGRGHLCVVAAHNAEEALKTARTIFHLTRHAFAYLEDSSEAEAEAAANGRKVRYYGGISL